MRGKTYYPDTIMAKPHGLQVLYYETGGLQDSSFFDDASNLVYSYRYFVNKKLAASYLAKANKKPEIEGYDEGGDRIKNYVFSKEAEYKGGKKSG